MRTESRADVSLNLTSERIRKQQEEASGGTSGQARARADADKSSRRESSSSTRRDSRKHEKTKVRAERMFDKQYASEAAPSDENAPRAALYTGKMGSKQRKASRMQSSPQLQGGASRVDVAGLLSGISVTSRSLKVATVVVCVFLTVFFLYAPAQQYYQAQREHDRLEVEYSTIEQRNEVLDVQNDALVSDAGMEDAVREKYGYIKSGEETAIVTGLSDGATDTSRDSEGIEANVLSSSVKAPEEWYTPLLDALFGVQ